MKAETPAKAPALRDAADPLRPAQDQNSRPAQGQNSRPAQDQNGGPDLRPAPRPADLLMRPESLAALQPSRLSGARAFMNRMIREAWDIRLTRMDVDAEGRGTIVYSVRCPAPDAPTAPKAPDAPSTARRPESGPPPIREFSLIAFSFPPRSEGRTGRIIGQAWDMMCTLTEGPATAAMIDQARAELPKLYRGRASAGTLVWGRSNRSMRAFNATLAALAQGRQPDIGELAQVCYLMRNTGLDGNGTFGTRPFAALGADHPLGGMLQAQLLTAYLMRELSCDLVEHLARLTDPARAVPLDRAIRRWLGLGNGSALGLIFYVHKHPRLIDAWLTARETALAAARALPLGPKDARLARLAGLIDRAITFRDEDRMHYEAFASSAQVALDLGRIAADLEELDQRGTVAGQAHAFPLDAIARRHGATACPEAIETYYSLLIELVPELADSLMAGVGGADDLAIAPAMTVAALQAVIGRDYAWALAMDMQGPAAQHFIWYKSETAEEPRRGHRAEVPEARDLGLDLPGDIQALMGDLAQAEGQESLARFLLRHPRHRHCVARVQSLQGRGYHTPHANINHADFIPIDLVRLMNVGLHGIDKTRDFLNRNLRGVLYHGAPTPDEIRAGQALDWFYPPEPQNHD